MTHSLSTKEYLPKKTDEEEKGGIFSQKPGELLITSNNGFDHHNDDDQQKKMDFQVIGIEEAILKNGKNGKNDDEYLGSVLIEYQKFLIQRKDKQLGYPVNLDCEMYVNLAPLLRFHINNVGDPFIDGNIGFHSRSFEVTVLNWFADLWEIGKDEYWGYVTNGGTEGNLHGILLGREMHPDGILYASRESHYSVFKAARMYKMKCEIVDTIAATGEIDYRDLEKKLILNKDSNPAAIINLNIGTTFKGGIDDLDSVIRILHECGFPEDRFYIHCDSALSGLIIPFLKSARKIITFKKPIGSMSTSGHKFLGCPMPCGVQMTRKEHIEMLSKTVEYIATTDATISGSRNGHSSIFMWYVLNKKGRVRIQTEVENCVENAQYLKKRLQQNGISAMCNPMSTIVVFDRPRDDDFVRSWQLACQGDAAHVVVMPNVGIPMLDDFVDQLVVVRNRTH